MTAAAGDRSFFPKISDDFLLRRVALLAPKFALHHGCRRRGFVRAASISKR